MQEIEKILKEKRESIDKFLDENIPDENHKPANIYKSLRYSVFAGGKRVRPILSIIIGEAFGAEIKDILPFACSIELVHTYSLIHDDLPALDNDDYRRGKLTNHKVFGEDVAILAGDALLTMAFEWISYFAIKNNLNPQIALKIIEVLSNAIGTKGMIGGQLADLEATNKFHKNLSSNNTPDIEEFKKEIIFIHSNKTAKLIQASCIIGYLTSCFSKNGDYDNQYIKIISDYGFNLGLAFQIIDDILDITGNFNELGKPIGSDIIKNKLTYPAIYGVEESKNIASKLINQAKNSVSDLKNNEILIKFADFLLDRTN